MSSLLHGRNILKSSDFLAPSVCCKNIKMCTKTCGTEEIRCASACVLAQPDLSSKHSHSPTTARETTSTAFIHCPDLALILLV